MISTYELRARRKRLPARPPVSNLTAMLMSTLACQIAAVLMLHNLTAVILLPRVVLLGFLTRMAVRIGV
jgi:hypothetical protein